VTWLMHMYAMTHPYVWHDKSICGDWNKSRITTHCNTLQYTATHCNTLQHIQCVTWLIYMWRVKRITNRNTLQYTATHYVTLKHTETHCNTFNVLPWVISQIWKSHKPPWMRTAPPEWII